MIDHIKIVLNRSQSTLVQDALGAVALMTILLGVLHIPGFV